ncbi:MAG: hypothetical protein QNL01_06480 [Akkermansiaceae bacterium]
MSDLAFKMTSSFFLMSELFIGRIFALEDFAHSILQLLLPGADLGRCDIVLLRYLLNALFFFDGFRGNTGFEFGGQVSSFSFHWSYFGLFARVRPANSSTILWLRFVGPLQW